MACSGGSAQMTTPGAAEFVDSSAPTFGSAIGPLPPVARQPTPTSPPARTAPPQEDPNEALSQASILYVHREALLGESVAASRVQAPTTARAVAGAVARAEVYRVVAVQLEEPFRQELDELKVEHQTTSILVEKLLTLNQTKVEVARRRRCYP